jgi:hypothetical protein
MKDLMIKIRDYITLGVFISVVVFLLGTVTYS